MRISRPLKSWPDWIRETSLMSIDDSREEIGIKNMLSGTAFICAV